MLNTIMNFVQNNQEFVFWCIVILLISSAIFDFFSRIIGKIIRAFATFTIILIIGGCFGLTFADLQDFLTGNLHNEGVENAVVEYFRFSKKISYQMEDAVTSLLENPPKEIFYRINDKK